jgi:hypothetical protein
MGLVWSLLRTVGLLVLGAILGGVTHGFVSDLRKVETVDECTLRMSRELSSAAVPVAARVCEQRLTGRATDPVLLKQFNAP